MKQPTLTECVTNSHPKPTMFDGKINADLFEASVRHLIGITDTATVRVNSDGLTIETTEEEQNDVGGTAVVATLDLAESDWDEYDHDHGAAEFGIELADLYSQFTGDGLDETVNVSIEKRGPNIDFTVNDENIDTYLNGEYPGTVDHLPTLNFSASVTITNGYELRDWLRGRDDILTVSANTYYPERGSRRTGGAFSIQPRAMMDEFETGTKQEIGEKLDSFVVTRESPGSLRADLEDYHISRKSSERLKERGDVTKPVIDGPNAPRDTLIWSSYEGENLNLVFGKLLKEHTVNAEYRLEFSNHVPIQITREFDDLVDDSDTRVQALVAPAVLPD